jgi:hypothetical protein
MESSQTRLQGSGSSLNGNLLAKVINMSEESNIQTPKLLKQKPTPLCKLPSHALLKHKCLHYSQARMAQLPPRRPCAVGPCRHHEIEDCFHSPRKKPLERDEINDPPETASPNQYSSAYVHTRPAPTSAATAYPSPSPPSPHIPPRTPHPPPHSSHTHNPDSYYTPRSSDSPYTPDYSYSYSPASASGWAMSSWRRCARRRRRGYSSRHRSWNSRLISGAIRDRGCGMWSWVVRLRVRGGRRARWRSGIGRMSLSDGPRWWGERRREVRGKRRDRIRSCNRSVVEIGWVRSGE